jgi:hypothetical protein
LLTLLQGLIICSITKADGNEGWVWDSNDDAVSSLHDVNLDYFLIQPS